MQGRLSTVLPMGALLVALSLLAGCGGMTKPHVPPNLPQPADGMARIVMTRESQLSGARWALDLVDVGDNITPNGMISYRIGRSRKPTPFEKIQPTDLNGDIFYDFIWINPDLVAPAYCGNGAKACENDYGNGLIKGDLALVWDTGAAFGLTGKTAVEFVEDNVSLSDQLDPIIGWVYNLFGVKEQDLPEPPEAPLSFFAKTFRSHALMPLMEKLRTRQFATDHIQRDFSMGGLGQFSCPEQGIYGLRVPDAEATVVFTSGVPYFVADKSSISQAYQRSNSMVLHPGSRSGPFFTIIDDRQVSRNIQAIGKLPVGYTAIWDRKPGLLRLAMIWYDGIDISQLTVKVEPGKTYYLNYALRHPKSERWTLVKVE